MREDAIHELPAHLAELFFSLWIPEEVFAILADRNVGVHAAAVDADNGLRQEASGETHVRGDLATDQLIQLNLVRGSDDFAVAIVNFELRGSDLRVVLFVLEAHGALHFRGRINESAQWIAGKRMIVAAGVDVLEFAGFVVAALRVRSIEEKAFNLIGGVQREALLFIETIGVALENSADIGRVRRAILINNVAKDEHLAGAENIGGRPIECAPVHSEPEVTLALRPKATNRRALQG